MHTLARLKAHGLPKLIQGTNGTLPKVLESPLSQPEIKDSLPSIQSKIVPERSPARHISVADDGRSGTLEISQALIDLLCRAHGAPVLESFKGPLC
jgi:hypothetical protein